MEIKKSIISFVGGNNGQWNVLSTENIIGTPFAKAQSLTIVAGDTPIPGGQHSWILKAFISNLRYTNRPEKTDLDQKSRGLGRPEFNYAALIPIKKSDAWWSLTQEERRKIFEEDSHHIEISARYLSVISRQLHHCRDLGEEFDFVTWFEFSSKHVDQFNELAAILRKTEEWKYVTREIDIRLEKNVF